MSDEIGRRSRGFAGDISSGWLRLIFLLAGAVLVVLAASNLLNPYLMRLAVLIALNVCLAAGYNLVITEAGQFHLGFVAYFAVGAYAVAIPTTRWGWEFFPSLGFSVVAVIAFSALLGILLLRFRGDYLSVVSLALAELLRLVLANWRGVTGGYQGLPGVPSPIAFGVSLYEQYWYLYLASALAVLAVTVIHSLVQSGAGLAWRSIRQNEKAAGSVGLQTALYKQLSYQVAGLFAGLAGGLYASYQTIVDPSLASIDGTILLLTIVILGGGTLIGIILATIVLVTLPEVTRVFDDYRMLLLGLTFIVLMNWRPDGFSRRASQLYLSAEATSIINVPRPNVALDGRPILVVEGVSRRFGGLRAVENVSFIVRRGEILGTIGPNGAGKTTLFNLISGVLTPNAGRIIFDERHLKGISIQRRSRLGIARTFQTVELCMDLSCLENVLLARLARRPSLAISLTNRTARKEAVGEALGALRFVGLHPQADIRAGALSYGDRRRLEIARALAAEPTLLLLDEPAAGMNLTEAQELVTTIRKIRELGITVVVIEHNVRLVREVSDRILVLADGRIIADERPETVMNSKPVIEAYLGANGRVSH